MSDKDLFLDTLICNVPFSSKIRILHFTEQEITKNEEESSTIDHLLNILFPTSSKKIKSRRNLLHSSTSALKNASDSVIESCGPSPFPQVDGFITSYINQILPGNIRSWIYFPSSYLLVYNITGNRYCFNIGRAHKSNNVCWVVDLFERAFYQKCYDPDCRSIDYKSPKNILPEHILVKIFLMKDLLEEDPYFLTDEEILDAVVDSKPEIASDKDEALLKENGNTTASKIASNQSLSSNLASN